MGRSVQETLPFKGSSLMFKIVPISFKFLEFIRKLSEQNGFDDTIKEPSNMLQNLSFNWWSTSAPNA